MKHAFLLLAFTLSFLASSAWAESSVALRAGGEIRGGVIKLSDVFDGVPKEIDRDLSLAPEPGKSVMFDVRVLERLADTYRLDWQPQSVTDRITLTRAATRITEDMIRDAVMEKLKAQDIKGKVEIAFDNHALEIALPVEQKPSFSLESFTYAPLDKRFRATARTEGSATPVTLPVTGRVTVKIDVPVLARRLDANTTIGMQDIDWLTITDDHATSDLVTDAKQLIGHETRHDLTAGEPIHARDVMPPRLVARGSLVTLKIETPFMLMTSQGRALQDGSVGETVRVTNTQSNRVVEGIVESSGVVRIPTAQKIASVE